MSISTSNSSRERLYRIKITTVKVRKKKIVIVMNTQKNRMILKNNRKTSKKSRNRMKNQRIKSNCRMMDGS
jgi:hypothetical protein